MPTSPAQLSWEPLSAGLCYQEPGLTPEDVEGEGGGRAPRNLAAAGEMAKMRRLLAEQEAKDAAAAGGPTKKQPKGKQAGKKRPAPAAGDGQGEERGGGGAAAEGGQLQGGGSTKRLKLSTSVNLLDAKRARQDAPRTKPPAGGAAAAVAAAGGDAGGALAGQPELIRRFMAAQGFAEPMPVQER